MHIDRKAGTNPGSSPVEITDNAAGIVKEESSMSPLETPPLNILLARLFKSANHGVSRVQQEVFLHLPQFKLSNTISYYILALAHGRKL